VPGGNLLRNAVRREPDGMRAAREIPRHTGAYVAGSRGRLAPVRLDGSPRFQRQNFRPMSKIASTTSPRSDSVISGKSGSETMRSETKCASG
jgi:hypothetical protein